MKNLIKALALGGAVAALAPLAHATPIALNVSITGSDSFNASTITFKSGSITSGMLNGTAITPGTALTFPTPTITYTPGGVISPAALIVMGGGVSFYVTSETPIYLAGTGPNTFNNLIISGTGYFTEAGFDQTNGTFSFTSQELFGTTSGSMTQGSFSASGVNNAATPEPSSLILLGTGVLGAAGMLRRRFALKSNA